MPLRVRIEDGIVRAEATGLVTAEDLLGSVSALFADPESRPGMPHLFDLMAAEGTDITADGMRSVISVFSNDERGFKASRLAVAADKPALFGVSRMYEAIAHPSGIPIRVHRTLEDALAWLLGGDPA
jgi:hypothetical protein